MSEAPSVAFAGSSGVEPVSALPAALAAELGLRRSQWVALGVRGSRLAQWTRAELPAGLRAVVVLLTANDARPTAERVREVDARLRRFCPVVVWLPPLPYPAGSRAEGRDALMREALAGAGVVWVERAIRIEPEEWSADRVHPTVAGFRSYARQVGPALRGRLHEALASAAAPAGVAGEIGRVRTARGRWLPLTSVDAVWLARAIVGEGGTEADALAIASTMVRRWAVLRDADASSPFGALTDLVVGRFAGADPYDGAGAGREVALRGYSQPVAVQWRDVDDHERAERRRRVRELPWDAIEEWRRLAVLRVLTGRIPLAAPAAVHFAAPAVVAAGLERHEDWRRVHVDGARNEFVSVAASRGAAEPVVIGTDGRAAAAADRSVAVPLGIGVAVALGAALVVRAWV